MDMDGQMNNYAKLYVYTFFMQKVPFFVKILYFLIFF